MTEDTDTPEAFENMVATIGRDLLKAPIVKVGRWQSTDVSHIDAMDTPEVFDCSAKIGIPQSIDYLQDLVSPNLPWAENQFQERVSGKPLNPGKTFREWPWYRGNVDTHRRDEKFSHTYMERYWPKYAGDVQVQEYPDGRVELTSDPRGHRGIRYQYGDLNDVVNLLAREPYTRQAYLPVFFPEDTGVVHGERVPCSLGYHFLFREGKLNIIYHIRSCDFVRHFRDDVYMTARLCQWMCDRLRDIPDKPWFGDPGTLTMHIGSLHCFRGDLPRLEHEYG